MGSRDIIFSVSLHVLVVVATVVTMPLAQRNAFPHQEVIRVNLAAMPKGAGLQPTPVQPAPVAEPPQQKAPEVKETPKPKPKETPIETQAKKTEKKTEKKPAAKPAEETPKQAEESSGASEEDSEPSQSQGGGGQGEVNAPVGAGSPFGGATIDNANFDYPYWFTQAFNKIGVNFHNRVQYPGPLVCVVYFQVIRSGRVIQLEVRESSGVPEFDDCCLEAVSKSTPFPPLPREFVDEIIGISIPFKYTP